MQTFQLDNKTGKNSSGATPNNPLKHLTASSLIGDSIFNASGEDLGRIKDIMIDIDEAKIEYVVIEFGGFLGMNQKYLAVPLQDLTVAKEHRHAFILNETKESLKRYPGFDKGHWPNTNLHDENNQPPNEEAAIVGQAKP
jgi:sporulation protein YlmC with PRC-barrel domain